MAETTDYRRANFRALVEKLGGPVEAAFKLEMGPSQVSQLISDNILKNMGNKLARRIEGKAGLPEGSLDVATTTGGMNMIPVPVVSDADLDDPELPLWRPAKAGGRKEVVFDRSNPYRPRGPMVAIYLPDDAMAGIGREGDLMIFDCWPAQDSKQDQVGIGSVVLLRHKQRLTVRTIKQSSDGGFEFIAKNDLFAPIHKDDAQDVIGVMIEVRWLRPKLIP